MESTFCCASDLIGRGVFSFNRRSRSKLATLDCFSTSPFHGPSPPMSESLIGHTNSQFVQRRTATIPELGAHNPSELCWHEHPLDSPCRLEKNDFRNDIRVPAMWCCSVALSACNQCLESSRTVFACSMASEPGDHPAVTILDHRYQLFALSPV